MTGRRLKERRKRHLISCSGSYGRTHIIETLFFFLPAPHESPFPRFPINRVRLCKWYSKNKNVRGVVVSTCLSLVRCGWYWLGWKGVVGGGGRGKILKESACGGLWTFTFIIHYYYVLQGAPHKPTLVMFGSNLVQCLASLLLPEVGSHFCC